MCVGLPNSTSCRRFPQPANNNATNDSPPRSSALNFLRDSRSETDHSLRPRCRWQAVAPGRLRGRLRYVISTKVCEGFRSMSHLSEVLTNGHVVFGYFDDLVRSFS